MPADDARHAPLLAMSASVKKEKKCGQAESMMATWHEVAFVRKFIIPIALANGTFYL